MGVQRNFWVVKQEPEDYSWEAFQADKSTAWTGVRNFEARNNLRAMKPNDLVLYYHSGEEKQIVGIARVVKAPFADPTAKEGDWVAVELAAKKKLQQKVTLADLKADPELSQIPLVRKMRLSVSPLTQSQFERILQFAKTKL